MIPDNRTEIPSPEVAHFNPHLQRVAERIPPVDPDAPILILLGRDILRVHKVREQINGPHSAPYAQILNLGWVIVGDICLGTTHKPSNVKTHVLSNGRTSSPNKILVKETLSQSSHLGCSPASCTQEECLSGSIDMLGSAVFERTTEDEKSALSVDDQVFLDLMDREVYQNEANSWVAPLPFHSTRQCLPRNREQTMTRLYSLRKTLDRKPDMKKQYIDFVQKILENEHSEPAPPLREHWYLPSFGVYHPQKPDQLRVVFDSSAEYEGVFLNKVLLSGPDLNNSLLGVLLRFRKEFLNCIHS